MHDWLCCYVVWRLPLARYVTNLSPFPFPDFLIDGLLASGSHRSELQIFVWPTDVNKTVTSVNYEGPQLALDCYLPLNMAFQFELVISRRIFVDGDITF